MIQCNEINQIANELLIAFDDCNKYKNSDLKKLVELIIAVNECNDGGPSYNTLIQEVYEPIIDEEISYPINTFHSISIKVINGTIKQNIGFTTVTYPKGTSLNTTLTTLNQYVYNFTVTAGSTVSIDYLIQTI